MTNGKLFLAEILNLFFLFWAGIILSFGERYFSAVPLQWGLLMVSVIIAIVAIIIKEKNISIMAIWAGYVIIFSFSGVYFPISKISILVGMLIFAVVVFSKNNQLNSLFLTLIIFSQTIIIWRIIFLLQ